MDKSLNINLGSQHVALLEPLRLELITQNETIVDVKADFGYVHRGIEKACVEQFKFKQVGYVVSRVCGLCSITHSTTYTMAIEDIMSLEVSKRAKYLRILTLELDRVHSHLLCLAHVCESGGFEAMFMRIMKDREKIMEAQEALTGNRIHFDYVCIGGVNRDISSEVAELILQNIEFIKNSTLDLIEKFESNFSLSLKFRGVGAIDKDRCRELNAAGPLARAAGVSFDVRAQSTKLPYEEIGFDIVVDSGGDVHARNMVRLKEILSSIDIIKALFSSLPSGELNTKVKGAPDGESVMRLEAPRGEIAYYLKGCGKQFLDRVRIKTPTYSNITAMIEIFRGQEYSSVPAILASFDPCMSCTAK